MKLKYRPLCDVAFLFLELKYAILFALIGCEVYGSLNIEYLDIQFVSTCRSRVKKKTKTLKNRKYDILIFLTVAREF